MSTEPYTKVQQTLNRLFRREAGRLVAALTHKLGTHNLALAEDTAQEALLAASRTWPYDGVPDNPSAWLHTVAFRKAVDLLRHQKVAAEAVPALVAAAEADVRKPSGEISTGINDAELWLLFLCCQNTLADKDRLALTLNIAFGFSAREIAQLFYTRAPAMSARLTRIKKHIQTLDLTFDMPTSGQIDPRVASVQKIIYLAFSLGPVAVRTDVALEALRLAESLSETTEAAGGHSHALAALLCFQASRLGSRTGEDGSFIPLAQQDRQHWDQRLIARGFFHLQKAQTDQEIGRYHLEAGIAALHAGAASAENTDWPRIETYYQTLWDMTASPVVALNHTVAIAMAGDNEKALAKLHLKRRGLPMAAMSTLPIWIFACPACPDSGHDSGHDSGYDCGLLRPES